MGERVMNPTNMFAGSPLNRLSWLRPSHVFLNAVISFPTTRWVVFRAGRPLLSVPPDSSKKFLAYLSTSDVRPLLGSEPFFGQGKEEGELISESDDSHSPTLAVRHRNGPVIFLGIHEKPAQSNALPSSAFSDPEAAVKNIDGTPYFAIDVAELDVAPEKLKEIIDATPEARAGATLDWSDPRVLMTAYLDTFTGAVYAEARTMIDWNYRNKFCPGCGSPTYSMWGGWKISCSSLLPWADNTGRKACLSANGLHNFTHPRTDPVVIMIAIDETGDKILLGRGKKFPGKFYSALAGFIEPGETFEDAVVREMWEEAGATVWDVKYHSGQPWPYPASLMVGFYSRADSSQPIRIDLDNELVDARWFTRAEVKAVLEHQNGLFRSAERKKANEESQHLDPTQDRSAPKSDEPPFKVPPTTAIAGVLIKDWVDGKIGFPSTSLKKGNL